MARPKSRLNTAGVLIVVGVVILLCGFLSSIVETGSGAMGALPAVLGLLALGGGLVLHAGSDRAAFRRFLADHWLVGTVVGASVIAVFLPDTAIRSIPALGGLRGWLARLLLLALIEGGAVLVYLLLVRAGRVEASDRVTGLGNAAVLIQISLGLLIAVNVIGVSQLTRRLGVIDLTETKAYTLGEETRQLLADLPNHPGTLRATYFDFGMAGPLGELARDFLNRYDDESPHLSVAHIDAVRDLPEARARFRELGLEDLDIGNRDAVVFTYHEPDQRIPRRKDVEVLRADFLEPGLGTEKFLGEQIFTSAIRDVIFPRLKVYFLTGHLEASIADQGPAGLSMAADMLERLALEGEALSLTGRGRIPGDAGVLVIVRPQTPLEPRERKIITRYLEEGGSLVLLLDPPVDAISGGRPPAPFGLEEYLASLGIEARTGYLCVNYEPQLGVVSGGGQVRPTVTIMTESFGYHPAVARLSGRGLRLRFHQACPVAVRETEEARGVRIRTAPLVHMPLRPPGLPTVTTYAAKLDAGRNPYLRDEGRDLVRQRLHLAVGAEKRRLDESSLSADAEEIVTRVVVVGDSDFLANQGLGQSQIYFGQANGTLFSNILSWAAERESLIAIDPKVWETERVDLDPREDRLAKTVGVYGLPLIVLLVGLGIAWMRRR